MRADMGGGITWQREGWGDVRGWGKLDAWTVNQQTRKCH